MVFGSRRFNWPGLWGRRRYGTTLLRAQGYRCQEQEASKGRQTVLHPKRQVMHVGGHKRGFRKISGFKLGEIDVRR